MHCCNDCGRQFQETSAKPAASLMEEYVKKRRTYADLSSEHAVSASTVKRKLDAEQHPFAPFSPSRSVVITDTTYFGRNWGVMVFLNSESGRVLNRKFVKHETNALNLEGVEEIKRRRTEVFGVVCDGHRRLLSAIDYCPVQMCRSHILQIIRRELTANPRLDAGRELLS